MTGKDIEALEKIFEEATDLNSFLEIDRLNNPDKTKDKKVYSNAEYGQYLKAFIIARQIIRKAFIKVEKLRDGNS